MTAGVWTDPNGKVVPTPNVNILIPGRRIAALDWATWRRVQAVCDPVKSTDNWWWQSMDLVTTDEVRIRGRLPQGLVTLLMAIAQGHPLDPILERLDAIRTPYAPEETP